jgi:hypothetical protein
VAHTDSFSNLTNKKEEIMSFYTIKTFSDNIWKREKRLCPIVLIIITMLHVNTCRN